MRRANSVHRHFGSWGIVRDRVWIAQGELIHVVDAGENKDLPTITSVLHGSPYFPMEGTGSSMLSIASKKRQPSGKIQSRREE